MNDVQKPKGDSYGALDEEVVPLRRAHRPFRSIRERQRILLWSSLLVFTVFFQGAAIWPALPELATVFGASPAVLAAVVAAFLLPVPGALLVANRLREVLGDRQTFVVGAALFALASAACGLATSVDALLAGRVIQGIGAGLCLAFALPFIAVTFANAKDQRYAFAVHGLVVLVAGVAGLVVGGLLVSALSWSAIFYLNVPLCAVAVQRTAPLLDDVRGDNAEARLDLVGVLGLTSTLLLVGWTLTSFGTFGFTVRSLVSLTLAGLTAAAFVQGQRQERSSITHQLDLGARELRWALVIAVLTAAGAGGFVYLATLRLGAAGPIGIGLGLAPGVLAMIATKRGLARRLLRSMGTRALLSRALAGVALGLLGFALVAPETTSVAPAVAVALVLGAALGLAVLPQHELLAVNVQDDGAERRSIFEACRFAGAGIGVVAAAAVEASPGGLRGASLVAMSATVAALVIVLRTVERVAVQAPDADLEKPEEDPRLIGVKDPDFLALGLGATGMLGMLWSIAHGRRAVGVELRGDPYLQFMQWRINENLYQHFAEIDRLILERYGEDRIPRRGSGELFRLSECFFVRGSEKGGGEGRADEVLAGFHGALHVGGATQLDEYVDDRWVDGEPNRKLECFEVHEPTTDPDPSVIDQPFEEVLDARFRIQVNAEDFLILLRRYLQGLERIDLEGGHEPRCRVFTFHRAVPETDDDNNPHPPEEQGFVREADGRIRVRVEAVRELDQRDRFRRIREPGTQVVDLGVPKLFMVSQGLDSPDAARLGLEQQIVEIDHQDGWGPRPAEADYIVGLIAVCVGNGFRHRFASIADPDGGQEYWSRQYVTGHEGISEAGWMAIEVPDFEAFDPIEKGLLPPSVRRGSPEYHGVYKYLLRDFYLDQVTHLTGVSKRELLRTLSLVLPRHVSVVEKIGGDAMLAENGVVAGDSFGNGHFLTRGGAVVGMLGHALRVRDFWRSIDEGQQPRAAVRALADAIKEDTETWIRLSEEDFRQPPPSEATKREAEAYQRKIASARHRRRSVASSNYRDDWSRLIVFPGRLYMPGLEPLDAAPPDAPQPEAQPMQRMSHSA